MKNVDKKSKTIHLVNGKMPSEQELLQQIAEIEKDNKKTHGGSWNNPTRKNKEESKKKRKIAAKSRKMNRGK
jgi:hypothetical protein